MSWQAVNWLMNPPKAYGADYLVALAVAERADEHGRGSYGSVEDIARRANLAHFGEMEEPGPDASDEAKAHYRSVRANGMRSAKRSLAALEGAGVLRDEGPSRYGTRSRSVCMTDEVPTDTVSADGMSGRTDEMSAPTDDMSELQDDMSVDPDTVSPKPSPEPSEESPSESLCEPNPPNPPHAGGYGNLAPSGLSPSSAADVAPPPAHLQVELREEEAELSALEAQLPTARNPERQRQAIDVQRITVADLRAQLGVDPAETREPAGAAA